MNSYDSSALKKWSIIPWHKNSQFATFTLKDCLHIGVQIITGHFMNVPRHNSKIPLSDFFCNFWGVSLNATQGQIGNSFWFIDQILHTQLLWKNYFLFFFSCESKNSLYIPHGNCFDWCVCAYMYARYTIFALQCNGFFWINKSNIKTVEKFPRIFMLQVLDDHNTTTWDLISNVYSTLSLSLKNCVT